MKVNHGVRVKSLTRVSEKNFEAHFRQADGSIHHKYRRAYKKRAAKQARAFGKKLSTSVLSPVESMVEELIAEEAFERFCVRMEIGY